MKKVDCKTCLNLITAEGESVVKKGKLKTQWVIDCIEYGEVRVTLGGNIIWKHCDLYKPNKEAKKTIITSESRVGLKREIGARIRKIRKELGLTQAEFGKTSKTKRAIISRIELGELGPRLELLISLCIDYSIDGNFLLTGQGKIFRKEG